MPEAAATTAQPAAPAPAAAPSIHERVKSALFGSPSSPQLSSEPSDEGSDADSNENRKASSGAPAPKASSAEAVPNEQVEGDDAPTETEDQPETEADVTDADDAQSEEAQPKTLKELADAIGWDIDKVSDLELPVKIDGKEGTARIRDLVRSYQLDGHINQKLATLDTDRKTFESKKVEHERATHERLLKLDAGVKTLERALMGEFAAVDWTKLQTEDPARFNSEYVAYQQRYAVMQDIANQIAAEQKQYQAQQAEAAKAKFDEEFKLLQAKVPEWTDTGRRNKDKAEIVEVLKDYGISKEEFESLADHRQLLVVRDAVAWRKLQKSKPATLNKVKAAPKLLKPGTQQSRAVVEGLAAKRERDTLRQTGKPRDAVAVLKRQMFR